MKTLKLLFLIALTNNFSYSQTTKSSIDWKTLIGKWECEKVILVKGKDSTNITEQYKPYFNNYYADLKYKEEYPIPGTSTTGEGKYKIDASKKKISFTGMVWTTKFSGGKVAVPDQVYKADKQDLYVLNLTPNILVLLQKYIPNTESQGDYVFYMKKK